MFRFKKSKIQPLKPYLNNSSILFGKWESLHNTLPLTFYHKNNSPQHIALYHIILKIFGLFEKIKKKFIDFLK